MLSLEDTFEARAKMTCGHVISIESMTQFLRSLVEAKQYQIICPSHNPNGSPCNVEWSYVLCMKVGVLTSEERQEFEKGFEQNMFYSLLGGKECPFC